MHMQQFVAKNTAEALELIRKVLGDKAVILSSRKHADGIEVVAASDEILSVTSSFESNKTPKEDTSSISFKGELRRATSQGLKAYQATLDDEDQSIIARPKTTEEDDTNTSPADTKSIEPRRLSILEDELKVLRGLLENQMAGLAWRSQEYQKPLQTMVQQRLLKMGFSSEISRKISSQINEEQTSNQAWNQAQTLLTQSLTEAEDDILEKGGIVVLFGPTGVGKTTTLAKLAAQYTLRHGPSKVALLSSDCYRIGAQEQLRIYGRLLGAPVRFLENAEHLKGHLHAFKDKELILIDTAGLSQRDKRIENQLSLFKGRYRIKNYLVISATSQQKVLDETVRIFANYRLTGTILSKIDECTSLGASLGVLMAHNIPISYYCDGQRVPEDLHLAKARVLLEEAGALSEAYEIDITDTLVKTNGQKSRTKKEVTDD